MPVVSVADLVEILDREHLLEPEQLAGLGNGFADPKSLARELLKRGWLTPYQANQLLQGKVAELILGNYVLLERLGEGGMGAVYKARHRTLGRTVAIKVIRKERLANPDAIRRFRREIKAAAQLNHPNIVRAFDADEVGGTHLLVMEYVAGTDLAKLVKQQGPLPIVQACDYIRQTALGLQHALEKGLVHRDIKPANLLLSSSGVVKILDMGLARAGRADDDSEASSTMTQEGAVMGSPDYIAPEQALESHTVDIRADLYSLGCSFYQLLTGRVPFPTGTLLQKFNKHQFEEPTPVEQLRPEVSPAIGAIVRKLMAKRPDHRYQTPAEVVAALDCLASSSGIVASVAPVAATSLPALTVPAAHGTAATPALALNDTVTEAVSARKARREAEKRRWLVLNAAGGGLLLSLIGLLAFLFTRSGTPGPAPTQVAVSLLPASVLSTGRSVPATTAPVVAGDWQPLFDGKDLANWEVKQGPAEAWSVGDGLLVANGMRGMLGTIKSYRDFTLRLEWRMQPGANSGVYVRVPAVGNPISDSMEVQISDDKVVSERSCGSLYALAKPLANAFKGANQWNQFEITCQGDQLTVLFNGQRVLDLDLSRYATTANRSKEGYVGLQSQLGSVEFRNIFIKDLTGQAAAPPREGWQPLFNGKDLSGIRKVGVAEDTFQVVNGEIRCSGKPLGYIVTEKSYSNYHLRFELKHTEVTGNSGVFLHVQSPDKVWPQCIEAQAAHQDMGTLFAIGGAMIISGGGSAQRGSAKKPLGQWNVIEIISKDGLLKTIVNGTPISEARSALKEGLIGWQSEGSEIWLRNLSINETK